jgi:Family of unknown function (DUF6174)
MSTQTPARHRRWLWYFVTLGLVAAVLMTWLVVYIRGQLDPAQQLNLDQLRSARKMWDAQGPKNYQMLYKVRRGNGSEDTFFVEARGGQVVSVLLNGQQQLEPRQWQYHSMEGLLNDIERFLKDDAQPDRPRTFCRGYFDTSDGHLRLFVRRVVGGQEGVEIDVETFKPIAAN